MSKVRRFLKLSAIFTLVAIFTLTDLAPALLRFAGLPEDGYGVKEAKAATALYLLDTASSIDPGTDEERVLSLTRGAASVTYVTGTVAGTVTPPTTTTQFTKTDGGANQTWYTDPLNAVTISGNVTFNIRAKESVAQANATVTAELLRADNAGNILSTIASVNTGDTELTTTDAAKNWTKAPTSTALSAGDRLAIRVHIDDGNGVTMGNNRSVKMTIGGASAGAAGDSYVQTTEAVTRQPITTLDDGTNPGNSTVAPSSAITDLDSFTLATNTGTDSVTALTATLTGVSSYASLSEVRITSDNGATTYFSAVANPASNTVNFSGGTPIPVTTTPIQFKIQITPKTHVNMPVPPGTSYDVSGTVTAFTTTNVQVGTDSGSATITVDNASPSGATAASGSAGNAQATLNWTTSASADFSRSVVLRWAAASAGSEVPAEGTDYANGNTITTATVACVRTADAASTAVSGIDGAGTGGCSVTALTNGQDYTYKVFQKDSNGNYDVGVAIGTFTPVVPGPNATSYTDDSEAGLNSSVCATTGCGGRVGQTVTIIGIAFGTVSAGSRANCAGGAGTGCLRIANYTVPDGDVSAWSATSITFTMPAAISVFGGAGATCGTAGANGLCVSAAGVDDTDGALEFFVFPNITSVSPSGAGEAKEGDSITITGNRFDSTQGTVVFQNCAGSDQSATIGS
ncbi:MAG: hypothetical protein AAB692_04310, partial [Patescibacteria group bacterium]